MYCGIQHKWLWYSAQTSCNKSESNTMSNGACPQTSLTPSVITNCTYVAWKYATFEKPYNILCNSTRGLHQVLH